MSARKNSLVSTSGNPTDLARVDLDWESNRAARARLLEQAEAIISAELAVQSASAKPSTCNECSVIHYGDWEAKNNANTLGGALSRVTKIRELLEAAPTPAVPANPHKKGGR